MPKLYFITGISGSGKTTVARKLVELGEVAFDSKIQKGLFRFADADGSEAPDYRPHDKEWAERYKWSLNVHLFEQLMDENAQAERVFLCGGADDLMQYWPRGEKVFQLYIDADTLLERLNRTDRDNAFGKDAPTQRVLLERLERKQAKQVEAGAIPIDACRPVDEVVTEIIKIVTKKLC